MIPGIVAQGVPFVPVIPGPGAHRYWRVLITGIGGTGIRPVLSQLVFMTNPYAKRAEGTLAASPPNTTTMPVANLHSMAPSNAGTTSGNYWRGSTGGGPYWISIDLGLGNDDEIGAVMVFGTNSGVIEPTVTGYNRMNAWDVEWSDDNVNWTTAWSDSCGVLPTSYDWYHSINPYYGGSLAPVLPIASPEYWLDPAFAFSDAGVTPTVDNDPIYQIDNQGTGVDFIQATLARRPTFKTGGINGFPYLECLFANQQYFADVPLAQPSGGGSFNPYLVAAVTDDVISGLANFPSLLGSIVTNGGKNGVYFRPNANEQMHYAQSLSRWGNITDPNFLVTGARGTGTGTFNDAIRSDLSETVTFQWGDSRGSFETGAITDAQVLRNTTLVGSGYFNGKLYELIIWTNTTSAPVWNLFVLFYLWRKYGVL